MRSFSDFFSYPILQRMPPLVTRKFNRSKLKKFNKSSLRKYPARLASSRITYQVGKAVSRAMNSVSENKIVSCTKVDESQPVAIAAGHNVYTKSFTVGNTPTSWSGTAGLVPIGGMTMPLGNTHNERNGKYIYLQKTHISMKIDMDSVTQFQFPCDFRVICFKSRRGNNPVGVSYRYDKSLFLDTNGNEFGHDSPNVFGTDIFLQPLNRKDWVIRSDNRFTLTNPAVVSTTNIMGYAGKYPVNKTIVYNLPYNAKTEIDPTTNAPADLDTHYVIVCYASINAQDDASSKWEVSLRGSTTYKDN